uniref:Uncharacterized protein n=1 Tax=Cannabis sativa TaxID=3483 RepID=A0A803Q109_CANSA
MEKGFLHRPTNVLSPVRRVKILEGFHALTPNGPTVEVEALEKRLAPNVGREVAPFLSGTPGPGCWKCLRVALGDLANLQQCRCFCLSP